MISTGSISDSQATSDHELGNVRRIPLIHGLFAIVDEEDYQRLSRWHWSAKWDSCTKGYYAYRLKGTAGKGRIQILMHRDILSLESRDKLVADHINHNTLDNRRINLRTATRAQNAQNRKNICTNKLQTKGVSRCTGGRSGFRVRLKKDGKSVCFYCASVEEGAAIYARESKRLFGEFAHS